MQTTIVIPVYEGVNLLDVSGPLEMFYWFDNHRSFRAIVVSEDGGPVTSVNGIKFHAEKSFADVLAAGAPAIDALWVPGGDPTALIANMQDPNSPYLRFIRTAAERAGWVCSVCEGAMLMARAGLLDGFEATTHWAFVECLKGFSKVKVVEGLPRFWVSGNRLTGGGISAGLDESLKLIMLLRDEETAKRVQQTTQYFPEPPVCNPITSLPACGWSFPGTGSSA